MVGNSPTRRSGVGAGSRSYLPAATREMLSSITVASMPASNSLLSASALRHWRQGSAVFWMIKRFQSRAINQPVLRLHACHHDIVWASVDHNLAPLLVWVEQISLVRCF